jgi:hypothetical protein
MSLPNGNGSLGSEDGSDHPPLFSRLASGARRRAAAAGSATANALSGAKDSLDSMRDGAQKIANRMDKWAADGVVRLAAEPPLLVWLQRHCGRRHPLPSGSKHAWAASHPPPPCAPPLPCPAQVGRTFRFKERSAKFTSELRAGLITFLMVGLRRRRRGGWRAGRAGAEPGPCAGTVIVTHSKQVPAEGGTDVHLRAPPPPPPPHAPTHTHTHEQQHLFFFLPALGPPSPHPRCPTSWW